jgi:hypothetical protein
MKKSFGSKRIPIVPAFRVLCVLLSLGALRGGTLYSTDFEEFPAGDGEWAGNEGWLSNAASSAAQGIIQDPVDDLPLGRAGFLGFAKPPSNFVSVFRPVDHDPVATEASRVQFESLLGLQDSTNGIRDRFHVSVFNISGDFLAALTFDNTSGKILSDDGTTVRDTGVAFQRGDPLLSVAALQILRISIDFEDNVWSATLDGIPLFEQTFTTTDLPRTLGSFALEWEVASGDPASAGNNWMLVADWLVASIPDGRFAVNSFGRPASGSATLAWPGHPGFDYQVEYSSDLEVWNDDLPGSAFPAFTREEEISFTDTSASTPGRFYRVIRIPSS